MGVLEGILAAKRAALPELRARRLGDAPERRPVALARKPGEPLRLIAEIKRRSPSAGALSTRLSVEERARAYERGGASMISVLCDERFFDGAFEHLAQARGACSLPLLCKDFVIDPVQLDLARAHGADAVLLIVRCLEQPALQALIGAAHERGLVPFVEIASEDEARRAVDAGADLVGVNARDLDTLEMDARRAERVLEVLPTGTTRVHLSGLSKPEHIAGILRSGVDAALIGEALMRQDDPEPALRALVAAAEGNDA
ncbi:MAG TPA: indole-3-glycerol phosphate synthase TrpC [Polyangiaceae bacterium]